MDAVETPALQRITAMQDIPMSMFIWHAPALDAPYYRVFYQAFSLTNKAG